MAHCKDTAPGEPVNSGRVAFGLGARKVASIPQFPWRLALERGQSDHATQSRATDQPPSALRRRALRLGVSCVFSMLTMHVKENTRSPCTASILSSPTPLTRKFSVGHDYRHTLLRAHCQLDLCVYGPYLHHLVGSFDAHLALLLSATLQLVRGEPRRSAIRFHYFFASLLVVVSAIFVSILKTNRRLFTELCARVDFVRGEPTSFTIRSFQSSRALTTIF